MPTTRTEVRKPSKYVLSAPVPKVYYGETTLTAHKPMKVKVAAEGKLIESEGCIDCWYALFERFWSAQPLRIRSDGKRAWSEAPPSLEQEGPILRAFQLRDGQDR